MDFDVEQHLRAVKRSVSSLERHGKPARAATLSRTYSTTIKDLWDAVTNHERIPRWFLPISGKLELGGRYQLVGLDPGTPGQHAAVDLILQAGASPSAGDSIGWTPLHTAGMAGHSDLARRLLEAGASPHVGAYGKSGGSPLSYALFYAKAYMGEVLVPVYPDNLRTAAALGNDLSRFVNGDGLTPQAHFGLDFYAPEFFPTWNRTFERREVLDEALTWAARNNQCEAMAALVTLGADINANPFRGTSLLWACYSDKVEAATWLLDHGADPDLRHDWGGEGHGVDAVAMHLAAQHNCVGCLNLLLDRGRRPDHRGRSTRRHASRLGGIRRRDRCARRAEAATQVRFPGSTD